MATVGGFRTFSRPRIHDGGGQLTTLAVPVSRWRSAVLGAVGVGILVVGWELVGQAEAFGRGWPPFSAVFRSLVDDWAILRRAGVATIWDAVRGFVLGMAAGISLSIIGLLITPLQPNSVWTSHSSGPSTTRRSRS